MIESYIDKKIGKSIVNSKMVFIWPSIIIGLAGGIYIGLRNTENPIDILPVIFFVMLFLAIIIFVIVKKIIIKRFSGTRIILDQKKLTKENPDYIETINREKIKSVNENVFGLLVSGGDKKIWIPKQVSRYVDFKNQLKI